MQTTKKSTVFSGQYLRNHSTLDIGVLGYIGIVLPKEHSPEVWSVPPVTPCIYIYRNVQFQVLYARKYGISISSSYFPRMTHSELTNILLYRA